MLKIIVSWSLQNQSIPEGNWKMLKAGTTETENGNGNRTTPFFAYYLDNQVSSRRPPCGSTPRLAEKR